MHIFRLQAHDTEAARTAAAIKDQITKTPSKSRRRLLISLGLLGIAGVLAPRVHKLLEVRRRARIWAEKWDKPSTSENEPGKIAALENASRVPTLIHTDLSLTKAGSPWVVDENVVIPAGVTLTIEAGSEILIGGRHYFTVEGRILARGTAEHPIGIRGYSHAEADKWAGLLLINTSKASVFQNVAFENSYYGVRLVHAAGTWTACSFLNVREVCSSFKAAAMFKNCLIEYKNYPGHANINVFKFQKGTAHVEDCTIHCPHSDYKIDGIDGDFLDKGVFRGNRLYGGISPNTDAIDVGDGSRNILIENNVITDFVDKGISVGGSARALIDNNIIVRCAIGVGVTDSSHAKITRTTFYGNDYAIKCYEKLPGEGGGHAEIDQCIIAGSKKAPFMIDEKSSIHFANTLCDQQLLPGAGNLQGTPVFEGAGGDRFNCTRIDHLDGSSASYHLSCAPFGASIVPYPNDKPQGVHE
jgi:parallel beta-helix repeat protein